MESDQTARDKRFELLFATAEKDALAVAAFRRRRSEASIIREALADWHNRHGDEGCVR